MHIDLYVVASNNDTANKVLQFNERSHDVVISI